MADEDRQSPDGEERPDANGDPPTTGAATAESPASDEPTTDEASGEAPSLAADLRSIRELLARTGRRDRLGALLEGAIWYGAALGAVALSAVLLGLVAPASVPGVTGVILLGGGGAVVLAAVGSAVRAIRGGVDPREVARRIQQVDRSFRNDLVAALEFGEMLTARPDASDADLGFSRRLARAHVRKTLRELGECADESGRLGHLLPDRNYEPPLLAAAGGVALMMVPLLIAPDRTTSILGSPLSSTATSSSKERLVRPIVGDIRLTYAPPRYTGKGRTTRRQTTGHIETVAGSEVTLSTYPLMEVSKVEMVLESGDGERVVPLRRDATGRLQKTLVLTESGTYHFRATLPDGTEVTDGMDRRIDLSADESPSVSITSHDGTVEVSPEDVLEIEFRVQDDYGIDSVERVHYFVGGKDDKKVQPVDVASLSETPEKVEGSLELDLRSLDLKPKDAVVFSVQATDNNARTGPGVGESDALRLKVASPEDKHLEIVRAQRDLTDKLLSLLGDYLEHPVGERVAREDDTYDQVVDAKTEPATLGNRARMLREIRSREEKVLGSMKKLVGRMKDDPLMRQRDLTLFEGLHERLRGLHERGGRIFQGLAKESGDLPERLRPERARRLARFAATMEANLEKGVLRLLELVASQKMDAVQATRKDIERLKDRLEELMKRYKETNDPELKEAIEREISRLKQRMSELMRRMQMQIRDLPKKHLNQEALKQAKLESGTKKLASNLESMEKKFKNGDIDGALKALKEMSTNLSSFGQKMDQQFSSAQPRGLSKLDKEVSKLMNRVNDLKGAEKELEKKTKRLQQRLQKKRQRKIDEMLDAFTDRMIGKVDRQMRSLDEIAREHPDAPQSSDVEETRRSLRRLRERLEQKDMKESLEAARDSVEKMRTMRFNFNLAERNAASGSEREREARRALSELDQMMPRGQQIEREIEKMMERAQRKLGSSESKRMKRLARKQKKISERAKRLGEKIDEASKEFPMLKQQLKPKLKGAKKQMGKAQRRLSKGQGQGALDSERSALEKLGKLQKSMRRAIRKQRQRSSGGSGMRKEDVEIPEQGEGASREALRDDVMEAMKEEKIEKYRDEIKRYYKSLVE